MYGCDHSAAHRTRLSRVWGTYSSSAVVLALYAHGMRLLLASRMRLRAFAFADYMQRPGGV